MRQYKSWSVDDINYIKKNKATTPVVKIANDLGVTIKSLYTKCERMGIRLNKDPDNNALSKINSNDAELIRQLKEDGLSAREIAVKFDLSLSHTYNILNYRYW